MSDKRETCKAHLWVESYADHAECHDCGAIWRDDGQGWRPADRRETGAPPDPRLTVKRLGSEESDAYDAEVWEGDTLVASVRVYDDAVKIAELLPGARDPYPTPAAPVAGSASFSDALAAFEEAVRVYERSPVKLIDYGVAAARARVESLHRDEVRAAVVRGISVASEAQDQEIDRLTGEVERLTKERDGAGKQ